MLYILIAITTWIMALSIQHVIPARQLMFTFGLSSVYCVNMKSKGSRKVSDKDCADGSKSKISKQPNNIKTKNQMVD